MADVDFFFDFISPYTYLAYTQLDGIAARTPARFKMWPMHLLNLMKIVGNTPTTILCKNKNKYAGLFWKLYRVAVEAGLAKPSYSSQTSRNGITSTEVSLR